LASSFFGSADGALPAGAEDEDEGVEVEELSLPEVAPGVVPLVEPEAEPLVDGLVEELGEGLVDGVELEELELAGGVALVEPAFELSFFPQPASAIATAAATSSDVLII
jgi:hypothetical protein